MQKSRKRVGRPPKELDEKMTFSINLKLKLDDYMDVCDSASKVEISPTAYARKMVLHGYIKAPFNAEELNLLRHIAGAINNLNQFLKHLNSGEKGYKLQVIAIIMAIKKLLDDSKKH